jgi:hypothetical protein
MMAKEPDLDAREIVPPYQREGYEKVGEYSEASEGDRKILAELVAMGSDLSKARHSIHYFTLGRMMMRWRLGGS